MVEQRPFKALVVGSSPTQPTFRLSALAPGETTVRALGGCLSLLKNDTTMPLSVALCCSFSGSFWPVLTFLTSHGYTDETLDALLFDSCGCVPKRFALDYDQVRQGRRNRRNI
jgi:hypothetical protein